MCAIDKSFSEKRDFIRMKVNSAIKITHAGTNYVGVCKDISGAGMSILIDTEFNIGDEVELLINQENDSHLPFHATAEVSRVVAEDTNNYIIGLAIKQINN